MKKNQCKTDRVLYFKETYKTFELPDKLTKIKNTSKNSATLGNFISSQWPEVTILVATTILN